MALTVDNIRVVPNYEAETEEKVFDLYEQFLSSGEEGVIVKSRSAPWENKRSKQMLKLKAEKECELKIVGFNSGEGKFANTLGSLICESEDGKVRVNVSGFSDAVRFDFWNRREEMMDTIVTIRYNGLIEAKDRDVKSLYLPRFVTERLDKTVANTIEEIK
jgi:DNA ligase-1